MHYYDSSDPNFIPQTYTPQPWGWYPLPGNPNEKLKLVEIPELTGSLEEIKFLLDLAEKSTATTATQTGQTSSNVTLGDVQLALANAQERVDVVDQYANESWRRFGVLYTKVLEAAADLLDEVRIYKKGRQTNKMYPKKILPKDWWTKSGYSVDIKIRSDKEKEDVNSLQKLNAAKQAMPENPALTRIYNRKLLEFADLTPDEVSEVEEAQKEAVQNPLMGQEMLGQPGQPQGQTLPAVPDIQGAGVPPMPNIQGQNA